MTPTADLYDIHLEALQVCELPLLDFGGRRRVQGPLATLKCHEDNSRVREALAEPGQGRVLVIDGGGSRRYALLGDNLAQMAVENGWAGVLVHGVIRDAAVIARMDLWVRALGTVPRKTAKRGEGQRDLPVRFGGATFAPGATLVADEDGVVVLPGA
ncbi:MAG: ribonuclease E activity regulator RraA [Myxococcales bacterium]|nr:ribonuclease E activity regulator RraA [Myxococcales bacterium]